MMFCFHVCLYTMYVPVGTTETRRVITQVVSCWIGAGNWTLEEQPVLSTSEPSLQSNILNLSFCDWALAGRQENHAATSFHCDHQFNDGLFWLKVF